MSDRIRVAEIFGPTIQGEGALIGLPTIFVRTGGCDYRCSWCDSLHAVDAAYRDSWAPMAASEVMAEVERLSGGQPMMVTLSGGNPAIQPLGPLIRQGRAKGYRFALETQGSVARGWFADLDMLVLSPKPPSSGMEVDWALLGRCVEAAERAPVLAVVPEVVRAGAASAALSIGVGFESNAQLAAVYGAEILSGRSKPGEMPVGLVSPPDIALNFQRLRAIGLQPPFSFFETASFVYGADGQAMRLRGRDVGALAE